ncbi:uncharacterized protein LOC134529811 isoform X2 [Bacillus rossius redtenbacheri]|uniref:uncharacterized protein LOC134529811 isoform X2 n=1 Tax=Bacillus rossius redtenbacheri TaxID=93214 RepID=UPI002FDE59A8
MSPLRQLAVVVAALAALLAVSAAAGKGMGGWDADPSTQYHIQTDEGDERYFRYQTTSGQYRKEKRLADGTVVGTYGWVDPNGYLRLRDYVADNSGYKVVRTKMVYVGKDSGATTALPAAPETTSSAPALGDPYSLQLPPVASNDISPPQKPQAAGPNTFLYTSSNPYFSIASDRNFGNALTSGDYHTPEASASIQSYQNYQNYQQHPLYDGIATTHNGFRYYLPRHYHEEENSGGQTRAGSFGYVDPFGIRRVVYYNTSPDTGFVHRKNNRYVGFNAAPYDPRL